MGRLLAHLPGVAGADEVGRGPLAGPVVAAAVVLPEGFDVVGIDDSKKLTQDQRNFQAQRIREAALFVIEEAAPEEIDRLNILWASMAAMERAIRALHPAPTRVLVDGNRTPNGLDVPAEAVVKGDGKYACIAAASILAKVHRDELMVQYDSTYPQYGFARHFGYPTPEHLDALRQHGPCPIHRRSFRPVRDFEQPCLTFEQ